MYHIVFQMTHSTPQSPVIMDKPNFKFIILKNVLKVTFNMHVNVRTYKRQTLDNPIQFKTYFCNGK